jgi:parallel beta-helix repeat protein
MESIVKERTFHSMLSCLLALVSILYFPTVASAQSTYYVSISTGDDSTGDGSSATPWKTIGHAIDTVSGGDIENPNYIRVAEGVYPECLSLDENEPLYGGYNSSDWSRDIVRNETRITGADGPITGIISLAAGKLDGFTIDGCGRSSVRGFSCLSGGSIQNCLITRCETGISCTEFSGLKVRNCRVVGNTNGIYSSSETAPQITNCTIADNSQYGIYGAGDVGTEIAPITNCILWDNGDDLDLNPYHTAIYYSDISDGDEGTGTISADPLFLDPANGDYHLAAGSPCIDSGTTEAFIANDFEGDSRPFDGNGSGTAEYDMGADEYATDSDDDGLSDYLESLYGTAPLTPDSDGDGIRDGDEVGWNADTDHDGLIDALDPDSDDDGFTDYIEIYSSASPVELNSTPPAMHINFAPSSASSPPGYFPDTSKAYCARGFGWR